MSERQSGEILIADDQQHILDTLELLLESEGFSVTTVKSPQEVMTLLSRKSFDLLLTDMNFKQDTTSGKEGIELVKSVREKDSLMPIVVMTAWASIELSVEAIRHGANDFIEKPWKNQRLLSLIRNQLRFLYERRDNRRLSALTSNDSTLSQMIVDSAPMKSVMDLIERTAKSDANILLTGESGVGKSHIASIIHGLSERKAKSFVSVNMGALTDTLFASELFGHIKGAFTDAKTTRIGRFEMADQGTLFLDEIANIPKDLQAKLLRVLESGEFEPIGASRTQKSNVRIVSASNVNFNDEIASGSFRQDLLYRLNTITIHIPSLRERPGDILPLADYFMQMFKRKYRRESVKLTNTASEALIACQWPGNVRELSHCIERAVLVCSSHEIQEGDLGLSDQRPVSYFEEMTLAEAEQALIERAMQRFEGNVTKAADLLGLSRHALHRRLEKYGLGSNSQESLGG
jgi:DNA-binding NtrC family response regulator